MLSRHVRPVRAGGVHVVAAMYQVLRRVETSRIVHGECVVACAVKEAGLKLKNASHSVAPGVKKAKHEGGYRLNVVARSRRVVVGNPHCYDHYRRDQWGLSGQGRVRLAHVRAGLRPINNPSSIPPHPSPPGPVPPEFRLLPTPVELAVLETLCWPAAYRSSCQV